MAKEIKFAEDARAAMLRGVDKRERRKAETNHGLLH